MAADKPDQNLMADDTIIAARPHFRREGDDLYFFLSRRSHYHLNAAEAEIWNRVREGPTSLASLGNDTAVQVLVESGLLEAINPVRGQNRLQILVVEPHCDDAALSIGATMWKMRDRVEFHLLTMASRSNYTTAFHLHRDYFNRGRISAMRATEGELFSRHLAGHYYCAGLPEATLRYNDRDWDLNFFKAHEVSSAIFNNRRAPAEILDAWTTALREFLNGRTFDEIWLPLGAGTHSDHDLARNAGLRVLLEERPDAIIRLYEDVPYGGQFPEHTNRILRALTDAGATLTPWHQKVTEEFAAKLLLLNIFASQFKVNSIEGGVERSAADGIESEKLEHLWTLEALPRKLAEDEMWVGAADVAKTRAETRAFLKGATTEQRVALFAISASGRWRDDLAHLKDVFPAARFVVYAGPRVCAEFQEVEDPRVDVKCLDGRSGSWLKAALREVKSGHRIVIAADALPKAKALRMMWPAGRTIVCSAMDHFIQALSTS